MKKQLTLTALFQTLELIPFALVDCISGRPLPCQRRHVGASPRHLARPCVFHFLISCPSLPLSPPAAAAAAQFWIPITTVCEARLKRTHSPVTSVWWIEAPRENLSDKASFLHAGPLSISRLHSRDEQAMQISEWRCRQLFAATKNVTMSPRCPLRETKGMSPTRHTVSLAATWDGCIICSSSLLFHVGSQRSKRLNHTRRLSAEEGPRSDVA